MTINFALMWRRNSAHPLITTWLAATQYNSTIHNQHPRSLKQNLSLHLYFVLRGSSIFSARFHDTILPYSWHTGYQICRVRLLQSYKVLDRHYSFFSPAGFPEIMTLVLQFVEYIILLPSNNTYNKHLRTSLHEYLDVQYIGGLRGISANSIGTNSTMGW